MDILVRGVVGSGREERRESVARGDYRHLCADLYPGTLNVVVDPVHTAAILPAWPYQLVDHEDWPHAQMWWKAWTGPDAFGRPVPVLVTYEARQPLATHIEVLARVHLRTEMLLTDGASIELWVKPWSREPDDSTMAE